MTSTTIAPPKVRQTKMLIGGQWRESQGGKSFATINPVNETVIAQVPDGNAADVDAAVKAADVVVLLVNHQEFLEFHLSNLDGKAVIDTRGVWR